MSELSLEHWGGVSEQRTSGASRLEDDEFLERLLDLELEEDPERFFVFLSFSFGEGVFNFGARSRVVSLEHETANDSTDDLLDSESDDIFRRSFLGVGFSTAACLDCGRSFNFSPCFFLL